MDGFIDACVTGLNAVGRQFCSYAVAMFLQVGVLAAVLLAIDFLLHNRIRATVRYWIWMLVFIKLLLPPGLAVPTGIGYWCSGRVPLSRVISSPAPARVESQPLAAGAAAKMSVETPAYPGPESGRVTPELVAPAPASHAHVTWQAVVFLLWGGGVLLLAGWVIERLFFVRRLIAQGRAAPGEMLDLLDRCRRQMGIRRPIGLRVSSGAFSPAVCGLLRPTILVPPALLERLSPDRLRPVLLHELAHVRRADLWVNCLQTVVQIIHFYNPLVWLVGAILRRVREQAVDEMVLVALGAEAGSYSATLIDIAEMAFLRAGSALGLVGVAESKKSLEGRIRHMATRPKPGHANVGFRGLLAVGVTAAVLLPMARAERKTEPVGARAGQGPLATLQDGVTMEVTGLGTAPWKTEQTWWQSDGAGIDKPEFKSSQDQIPREWPETPNDLRFRCTLLLRFSNHVGKDVSLPHVRFSDRRLRAGLDAGMADDGTRLLYLVGSPRGGLDTADMFCAVGAGPFKEAITRSEKLDEKSREVYTLEGGLTFIREPLYLGPTKTLTVDLTCPQADVEYRVTAKLKNGRLDRWHGSAVDEPVKCFSATPHAESLKAEDIERLIIEYRPCQWVEFEGISLVPGQRTEVRVWTWPRKATTSTVDGFMTYQVNRSVADFPPAEDLSTPEAAYATMNRLARRDPSAWQKVSVAALADRLAREGDRGRTDADSEWTGTLTHARIDSVIVWNNTRAAVMAKLPPQFSSKKIVAPIDVRFLQRENARWLNTGNDRVWTVEEARAEFIASLPEAEGFSAQP